ncbi:hypothetical protein C0995_011772 [Termitomyces sp. Mi166|nr:hypothetical protein C0995_011772 [Termitomyces sp. Mi166\
MAPFLQAVNVRVSSSNGEYTSYTGEIDPEWVSSSVTNGGYVLALLVDACIQHQSTSGHREPIHVTAHFLRTSVPSHFEIRVRILKTGRGFTNLTAELYQQEVLIITAHQIFGNNSTSPQASDHTRGLNLAPPSSYARRIPLYTHPSTAVVRPGRSVWKFQRYIALAPDPHILAKNAPNHSNRTNGATIGGEGLEWGAWFTFQDKGDEVTPTSLAFLVDIFAHIPSLMPPSERPGLGLSWFPTIVLSLEFKAPIPPLSVAHARRTVGLYSSGKFLNDGRHDGYVEVWTAPCDIGKGKEISCWREKQVCIAVATQMASIIPMEVNMKRGENEVKL